MTDQEGQTDSSDNDTENTDTDDFWKSAEAGPEERIALLELIWPTKDKYLRMF